MSSGRYALCVMYVRDTSPEQAQDLLAQLLGAKVEGQTLYLPALSMDVRTNPDVDPGVRDDFVRWPVLIEAEAEDASSRNPMVEVVARMLEALWEAGNPAVAACDFEDELPWAGGIRQFPKSCARRRR
jgi:hypothetical protein